MNKYSEGRWQLALGAMACVGAVMAGCASVPPPTAQMAVSKSAIANAASAGGAEFAPAQMKIAQEKMDRANHAMGKEDYASARTLAEEAQADARLAEKTAESAKAQKAADAMQDSNRVLGHELNRKTQ
jgi:uncharacterized protein DUF4398